MIYRFCSLSWLKIITRESLGEMLAYNLANFKLLTWASYKLIYKQELHRHSSYWKKLTLGNRMLLLLDELNFKSNYFDAADVWSNLSSRFKGKTIGI